MNKRPYRDILDSAAADSLSGNTDLWPRIMAGLDERKSLMNTLRTRPLIAMLIALLILLTLSGVVYAIGKSLGYIPGIGLVDQSAPMRVLAEPVALTRDGVTVKVEEAVLSADKTVIKFSVDGISMNAANPQDITKCNDGSIGLPDGSSLKTIGGYGLDDLWGSGFAAHFTFELVPAGVTEATFIPPCIQEYLPGTQLENWKLPLRFIPAPPEMTVMPVIEITPSPQATNENPLTLEKVIETDSGYILIGKFSSVGLPPDEKAVQFGQSPTITDAGGQNVPFNFANYQLLDLPAERTKTGVFSWAFELQGKQFNWPIAITVNSLAVEYSNEQAQFEFDSGPTSQDGQVWENLNINFKLAGHPVHVLNVIRMPDSYQFNFATEDSTFFNAVDISIGDSTQGMTGIDGPSNFGSEAKFTGAVPSGKLTVLLTRPIIMTSGSWQLQWKPDHAPTLPTPTAASVSTPQACLTIDSWKAALANPAPIPADPSQKVIASGPLIESEADTAENYGSFIVNLDGSDKVLLGPDITHASPSPDGSQVVYRWEDGLHIKDVASGVSRLIPNTILNDGGPLWSPDGTRIAFNRLANPNPELWNIYVVNPDGSSLQRVGNGTESEILLGWLSDGSDLLYSVEVREGTALKILNLASGMITNLFTANTGSLASISPDENEIAFFDNIDKTTSGLYIARLDDNSNRRLVALIRVDVYTEQQMVIGTPIWSPDGKWLAVSIAGANPIRPTAALVNPQTCQIIPLPITGEIDVWLK